VELHTSDRSASNGEQHRKDDRFPVGPIIPDGRRKTPNHVATRKVCQHRTPGIESCKHKVVEASNAGSWPGLRRQVGIVHPESDGEVHGSRWIFDWQKSFRVRPPGVARNSWTICKRRRQPCKTHTAGVAASWQRKSPALMAVQAGQILRLGSSRIQPMHD